MTMTVAAALIITPALGLLAQRLYDEEELIRLKTEAVDSRIRADMAERGWLCPSEGPAAAHAMALQSGHGVEILRPQVAFRVPLSTGVLAARPPTGAQVMVASKLLREELGRYPTTFLRDSRLRRVLLCDDLYESNREIPSMPNYLSTLVLDVDAPEEYLRRLVHHEVYHFADFADDQEVKRDDRWAKLNDNWFVYGNGGRAMRDPRSGDLTGDLPGFLSQYATSAVEEDKAEVFAFMMVEPERVAEIAGRDPVVARKVRAMKDRLEALSPVMGEEFWHRQRLTL